MTSAGPKLPSQMTIQIEDLCALCGCLVFQQQYCIEVRLAAAVLLETVIFPIFVSPPTPTNSIICCL